MKDDYMCCSTFADYDTHFQMAADEEAAVIYKNNTKFREYVDRYCSRNGKSKEEAFKHKIVQEIAKEYEEGGCNYKEGEC